MRTVPPSRGRTASARGALVALTASLGLLLSGCAPLTGDPEPAPNAASGTQDPAGAETGPGTTTSSRPDADPSPDASRDQQEADQKAAEKKAARQEAAQEAEAKAEAEQEARDAKAADEKAAAEQAAEEAAAAEEAEQKAAEQKQAEQEAAEQAARDKMLEYGDSGDRVVALQKQLQDLGYFLTDADGSFGPATQQAVWALQKAAGMYRDGVVGPQTQAAIDAGTRPSAHTSSGKAVEIDLARQLLMTVENGKVTRIFNASSGSGEQYETQGRTLTAHTPSGSYSVYKEDDGMHESSLDLGNMWRPKYFTGAYAVHGSPSIPPYAASHGCVRVSNSAIDWLWDSWGMPQGTPVILY